jgi:hypothetical protein
MLFLLCLNALLINWMSQLALGHSFIVPSPLLRPHFVFVHMDVAQALSKQPQSHRRFTFSLFGRFAVQSSVPLLLEEITRHFDVEAIRDSLKTTTNPPAKLEMWEQMKVMSVARMLTGVYSLSLLSAFTSVQLNILGGHLSNEQHVSKTER